ncbi:MAG TPA: peptidase T [Gaiellaceae bacterium]|nr:peptidase T [Gaiellaceae bacterium]
MPDDGYSSELARELAPEALERFLRYARIHTTSDPHSEASPSTPQQWDLLRLVDEELRELGLEGVELTEHGVLYGTLPATVEGDVPQVGFVAHVDTFPGVPGENVQPQVVVYEGGRLPLPGDPSAALDPERSPELAAHVGHELVTSDGTTLLGADDKAGLAEIVAAFAYLQRHPELPHGPLRIGVTPDEEIGRGTDHFDLDRFGCVAAYTLDGSTAGELEGETFNAYKAIVDFHGVSTHTGTAKGRLVNPLKVAGDFLASLPRETLAPEVTEGYEGFVHPDEVEGTAERCRVILIVRDHDWAALEQHAELVRRLADEAVARWPGSRVELRLEEQYRNMKEYLDRDPRVMDTAEEAYRREGLDPKRVAIRGGTDGSRLSELGLPTPNVFTGGHDYHSRSEWACVRDMGSAAAVVVRLAQVWAEERATPDTAAARPQP